MYKEIAIYEAHDPDYNDRKMFLNKDVALDYGRGIIAEGRLLYTGKQAHWLNSDGISIFQFADGENVSSWFLTKWDALESPAASSKKNVQPGAEPKELESFISEAILSRKEPEPVKCPFYVELKASNGRYCAHADLHPNRGGRGASMICFPDRSVVAPAPGIMRVDSVEEKATYAFLKGEMVPYGMVDIPSLLDYLWDNGLMDQLAHKEILFIDHPSLGKFICSEDCVWLDTAVSYYAGGRKSEPFSHISWRFPEELRPFIVRETTLGQLLLEDSFSEEDFQTTLDRFCKEPDQCTEYDAPWMACSVPMPEIIEQGIAEGLLKKWRLSDHDVVDLTLSSKGLYKLAGFSDDEIMKMAEEFRTISLAAGRKIENLLNNGALHAREEF